MSSYLNFYLVPKKKEKESIEPKPLLFQSYSRGTDVYQYFKEEVNPTFIGNGEEPNYTELNVTDASRVLRKAQSDLFEAKENLNIKVDAFKALSIPDNFETAVSEYIEDRRNIEDLQSAVHDIKSLQLLVRDTALNCNDFEKLLINID